MGVDCSLEGSGPQKTLPLPDEERTLRRPCSACICITEKQGISELQKASDPMYPGLEVCLR